MKDKGVQITFMNQVFLHKTLKNNSNYTTCDRMFAGPREGEFMESRKTPVLPS